MANLKASCLRKGIVVGRVMTALNDLHLQVDVLDQPDFDISRGAIDELKGGLKALRKNFRTSPQEVQAIGEGVKKISKLIRKKMTPEARAQAQTDLKTMRTSFRTAVDKGFLECNTGNVSMWSRSEILDDQALYTDLHPDRVPKI